MSPARITAGTAALWRFDEGTGNVVLDHQPPPMTKAPQNLTVPATGVGWVADGIQLTDRAALASASNPHFGRDVLFGAQAATIEVWVTPASATQGSGTAGDGLPNFACIFAMSGSIAATNITIAQVGDHFTARIRTASTTTNGDVVIESAPGTAKANTVHHLVAIGGATARVLYVDNVPFVATPIGAGAMSNFDEHYNLLFGDEHVYDRRWLGTLWFAAAFARELSASEVKTNFDAGHDCNGC